VTADGIQPYRQLLNSMNADVEAGKDLSKWSTAVELFSSNPKYVDPSKRQMVIEAQQQLQEQRVKQVAEQNVPSVEGGPEAQGRTQEARGRLAMFNAIQPDDPNVGQKLEAFTKAYGSAERLQQQIEADKLVVQDEDGRVREREQYASRLRMAPAELAKQAALSVDPASMMLPMISRAIQDKGIEGLSQQDRNRIDAYYTLKGQPEKLAIFSEGSKVNELKRYQQDLQDANLQKGAIEHVQSVLRTGKERIQTFEAAINDSLSLIEKHGTSMSAESYEQRQAALEQLKTGTQTVMQDWESTITPVREDLSKQAGAAREVVSEITKQMQRPGVDRVTLSKRKDFYTQAADTYERMNHTLALESDIDVAMKRAEIRGLQMDAKSGETDDARRTASALIPKKQEELKTLVQTVEKNSAMLELDKERLSRFAKLSQARITAGDRKLEQQQANGTLANTFLAEWQQSGFKLNPDAWYTQNQQFTDGADNKMFMDIVKPALDSRTEIKKGMAERELLQSGKMEDAGAISAKYGLKPSDILPVLKDPTKSGTLKVEMVSPAERKELSHGRSSVLEVENVERLYSKEYVGMLDNLVAKMKGPLDLLTPKEAEFRANVKKMNANLRKFYAGTAQSKQELLTLIESIPDTDMAESQFKASLKATKDNLTRLNEEIVSTGKEVGITMPGSAPTLTKEQKALLEKLKKERPEVSSDLLEEFVRGQ
jgi:hypothetical protein